ncbi:hypothetical protein OG455_38475 [Kitasatospora sp. NBC_01287]|uniref:hypothetical protein n=1 Tax=Kitasatospora sp. NBC_01287 TaxID=2903573 RepID=UPI0022518864|nr:hypothetical protein [Kitasatospora sp. NBC_01287]MCX4751322.1 hypothetical protein [Kitasatospora sp. NBC_01287]
MEQRRGLDGGSSGAPGAEAESWSDQLTPPTQEALMPADFCNVLAGLIKDARKDAVDKQRSIDTLNRQLAELRDDPEGNAQLIQLAEQRLTQVQSQLDDDNAQIEAAREEYQADNCPEPTP